MCLSSILALITRSVMASTFWTKHFVQEASFIGFAMNKALSIGQRRLGFANIEDLRGGLGGWGAVFIGAAGRWRGNRSTFLALRLRLRDATPMNGADW